MIENLFYELEKIAISIESTVPEEIEWHDPNYKLSTIDKIELFGDMLKPSVKLFTNAYVVILYIALGLILTIGIIDNIIK